MMTPRLVLAATLTLLPLPLGAQTAQDRSPTPTPTSVPPATPGTLGNLGGFSLPSSRPPANPTLPTPVPVATPTPTPALTNAAPVEAPPRRPAAQRPTSIPSEPLARPTRTPAPAEIINPDTIATEPTPGKTPAPVAAPIPDSATLDSAAPDPAIAEHGSAWLWWAIVGGVLAALALAALTVRRQRSPLRRSSPSTTGRGADPTPHAQPHPEKADSTARATPAVSLPAPVAPISPADHPALQLDLRPVRAGLNLLSALVEGELTITNAGRVPLESIAIAATLVSAHRDSDAELAAFAARPIGRPVVPVFTLTPGEARTIRVVAPLSRAAIQPMHAGGRAIFVPIVAIACRFVSARDEFRAARAFTVGVERVDSAKLAPIWLDAPPRMYDTVAARPHALPV